MTRPAPTSPPPSPSSRAADTVKVRRRPSTLTRVASARTTEPTPTGARWSNCTRVATLDWAPLRCPSVARQVASSHSAMSRGVPSTGTSPERKCSAVSSSPTVSSTCAVKPAWGPCPAAGASEGRLGTTITIPPVTDTSLIDVDVLERVLSAALVGGGDMAEVFAEDSTSASAMLDDRRVEELSSGRARGAGIRVVDGDTTGLAHTADLSESGLLAAARAAAAVARQGGGSTRTVALGPPDFHGRGERRLPSSMDKAKKLDLLMRADDAARSAGDAISQVQVGCGDT